MKNHELKILPEFLKHVLAGTRTFEIRKSDRDFKTGDIVLLRGHDLERGYTGITARRKIGHVTDFRQREGYVVFSLLPVDDD